MDDSTRERGRKGNRMADLELIKWHAEKIKELVEQDPNNPRLCELYSGITSFLGTVGIDSLEAQAPPGVDEDTIQDDDA